MTKTAILNHLRDIDREAYIATLFLAEDKREPAAALWAFNNEVERIRDLVSEPLPGEIRLQWWRDALTGERSEEGAQHPVGAALLSTINQYDLPRRAFDALCEARIFDLYNDPMPSLSDFEGYLGETRSVLFQMLAQIVSGKAPATGEAAGHAGIAYGVANLLRLMAFHRTRGQIFVPKELLQISGLTSQQFLALEDPSNANGLVQALTSFGRDHLAKAEAAIAALPKEQRGAFILLGICQPVFKRAEKRGGDIALETFSISPFTAQWYLTRYAATI
ncbi:phytoene/squalene synthase family protein [Ahrensia sp. 13_GOM-1096m]|uniref:phytoene/squalene synthase family protein n=1 Tax=Ahrensia sp. 13_GOM-1096m TaxID=1380380 RepID=UPI000557F42C|nr:phytoene/squalene synthase family protein [Ahrensia sp. 13_GOM-1096m]